MKPLPPYPGGDLREWARQVVDYLLSRERIEQETLPQVVLLPHKKGGEKALTDGLLMYDPVAGEPVFTKNGQWCRMSDGTPV